MAQCPNCGATVAETSEQCLICSAVFGGPNGWHPVPDGSVPQGEVRKSKSVTPIESTFQPRMFDEGSAALARKLTHVAVAMWFASLLLPGFVVSGQTAAWPGGAILLSGLIFGWMVNGWAAYANLFLAYVVVRNYRKKAAPFATGAMLFLLLSLVTFREVLLNEGGATAPVVSWGVGAVLWIVAILLAAIAAGIHLDLYRRRTAIGLTAAIGFCILPIGVLGLAQRHSANDQEKELLLSAGIAFTTTKLCGIPLVWPEKAFQTAEFAVELDVTEELRSMKSELPLLLLPELQNVQEGAYQWRTLHDPDFSSLTVKVRSAATAVPYRLEARRTSLGATLRIVDTKSNFVAYEQQLKSMSGRSNAHYCPYATQSWSGLTRGYDTAILHALGQDIGRVGYKWPLKQEYARQPCNLGTNEIDGVRGLREWDGRQVILEPESIRSNPGFCSGSYIGLVYVSEISADPRDLGPVVHIFDRRTMKPIAAFNDSKVCRKAKCDAVPSSILKGIRINGNTVFVETDFGELQANRIDR